MGLSSWTTTANVDFNHLYFAQPLWLKPQRSATMPLILKEAPRAGVTRRPRNDGPDRRPLEALLRPARRTLPPHEDDKFSDSRSEGDEEARRAAKRVDLRPGRRLSAGTFGSRETPDEHKDFEFDMLEAKRDLKVLRNQDAVAVLPPEGGHL